MHQVSLFTKINLSEFTLQWWYSSYSMFYTYYFEHSLVFTYILVIKLKIFLHYALSGQIITYTTNLPIWCSSLLAQTRYLVWWRAKQNYTHFNVGNW